MANPRYGGGKIPAPPLPPPPRIDTAGVMSEKGYATALRRDAELLGKYLADGRVSFSKIRSVLDEIQRFTGAARHPSEDEFELVLPKLAYVAGKEHGDAKPCLKALHDAVKALMDAGQGKGWRIRRIRDFFEAVVAYHRLHGGRD